MSHESRLLSEPHRVIFGGFESTTPRLQQWGWELSAWQEPMNWRVRLAMRHQQLGLHAITNAIDFSHMMFGRKLSAGWQRTVQDDPYRLTFEVIAMGRDVQVRQIVFNDEQPSMLQNFGPIDAYAQVAHERIESMAQAGIFATPLVRTQELIVDPDDVQALLERIKDLQRPEQEQLRAKQRLAASREGMEFDAIPRQAFHAQILSISK